MRVILSLFLFMVSSFATAQHIAGDNTPHAAPIRADVQATLPTPTDNMQPFGATLFSGNFLNTREDGLNPNYVLAPGDQVHVRTWGAVNIDDIYTIDGQGNIFLPEVGPVRLEGVKNEDLTEVVLEHVRTVYIDDVDVYTNLATAQPVAVYVTGLVNKPGRYAGVPSDSILYFLDIAGGIDSQMGSYREIEILRAGKPLAVIDLYDFILHGAIATPQLQDNDTILVKHRGPVIKLQGNVARPALIELDSASASGADILKIIPQAAQANEATLVGMKDGTPFNRTMPLDEFLSFPLQDGDMVTLRDDGRADTILVTVEGEFEGPSVLSVKRGTGLVDVLHHIPVNKELSNPEATFIRRQSVARAQRDAINDSLFRLERSSLLALSGSSGEVSIRTQEAALIEQFAERARLIDPLGRVVTSQDGVQQNITLASGDVIVIPARTQIVKVAGEVLTMHASTYRKDWTADDYIRAAGNYSNRADTSRVIIHHQNAEVEILNPRGAPIRPGDEILVPPKIDKKYRQFAIDLLEVISRIAVAARVAVNL